jgi:hypothetical protein
MMKTYDLGSSLFWLFFSISVLIESLRMGIGTPLASRINPGLVGDFLITNFASGHEGD